TKIGNQRYIYISTTMMWWGAQAYCRQHYTDLASGRDSAENSLIIGMTPGWTWFGLFRDSWKWTDQTNFTSSPISWMPGKPDNALGSQNCAYLNNSQLYDAQCSKILPFYCYK
ncbi:putative C-type lectin domain family 20 member A isoform X1, partial [Clarias magur]